MTDNAERSDEEEWSRLLKEEIIGVIPATVASVEGPAIPCGIVFATKVLILARLMNFKDIYFSLRTAKDRYYALQREWGRFEHQPASAILESKNYQCYILPHSNITHFHVEETGRFRKRCTLVFHTEKQDFVFKCATSRETVSKDLTWLLRRSGVRFSPGGMQNESTSREG